MTGQPPCQPGDVLELAEEDYRFGTGPLTLRVTGLIHVQEIDQEPWLYVRGQQIGWQGAETPRQVLVRLAALTTPPAGG